jgi:hypothetical protein
MDHDGPPAKAEGTQLRVQVRRDGWSIDALLDVKESGRADEPIEYLCKWHLHEGLMEPTWEGKATVRDMWKEHRRPLMSKQQRSEEADAAMAAIRAAERGVGKFNMLDALEAESWARGRGPSCWSRQTSTRARRRGEPRHQHRPRTRGAGEAT